MYVIERNGRYTCCQSFCMPPGRKKRTVSITIPSNDPKSLTEAHSALERHIQDILSGCRPKKDLTLAQLADRYCAERDDVKPQTLVSDRHHLNAVLRVLPGDWRVNEMTAYQTNTVLREKDKNQTTRAGHVKALKSLIKWGEKMGYVDDASWLKSLQIRQCGYDVDKIVDNFLEREELETLLSAMTVKKWQTLTRFLVLSGLRVGEALALSPEDVEGDYIEVTKTWSPILRAICPSPKTASSARRVYIQPELREVINDASCYIRDMRLFPFCYDSYAKYFREVTERVLKRRLTPHSLRHTHVSMLAASGVEIGTISRRLGHKSSKVTRDIYLHTTREVIEKDNAAILSANILANTKTAPPRK